MNSVVKGCVAEFIGTFALCFFGCAAIALTHGLNPAGGLVTVALAHGIALIVFVTACMYISGAQFNPAVSIGLLVIGKQDAAKTLLFVLSQCLAAACAVGMLVLFFRGDDDAIAAFRAVNHGATLGSLSNPADALSLFGLEALQTFALMFCILAAVVDARAHRLGGFCVGLPVMMGIVAFGPLTGSSMNPARSLGPALYGHWDMHWVYWAAPITGAVAAALVYKLVWDQRVEARQDVPPLHEGDATRKA